MQCQGSPRGSSSWRPLTQHDAVLIKNYAKLCMVLCYNWQGPKWDSTPMHTGQYANAHSNFTKVTCSISVKTAVISCPHNEKKLWKGNKRYNNAGDDRR